MRSTFRRLTRPRSLTPALLGAFALAAVLEGCGGGGGSGGGGGTTAAPATETGEVTLAVTDAPSDDLDVFEVEVVSFRFVRQDGASVEVLPQATRVDFAQLVTVSEVIAGASLPVGNYPRAFMTLDFSQARAMLVGNATPATLVDDQGRGLGSREELEIVFPGGGLTVGPRRGYFAVVDFDLDQSLVVDTAANRIEVASTFFADIDPAQPKDTRVTGVASVISDARFQLDVRLGLGLVSRGRVSATTDGATVFDLGGQVLTGAAGFAALAQRGDGTLLAAEGVLDPQGRTLAARRVVVLPGDLDEVGGLVVARAGGPGQDATLTVRGVTVRRQGGGVVAFNDTVTLRTSFTQTRVGRRGAAAGALTTDAINVGQRLLAYGRFQGGSLDLTQSGAGFVRLVETGVGGALTTTPGGGTLTLDVTRIGRRPTSAFDFAVGGVAQADPRALVVSSGALGVGTISSGSPVWVRGFFDEVRATAPSTPDFVADSIVDRSGAASLLRLRWLPATATPLAARSGAEATLSRQGAVVAQVDQGLLVPTTLSADPVLAGQAGFYAVRRGARISVTRDAGAWLASIEAETAGGARAVHVRAVGRWDPAAGRLTATRGVALLR